jgi:hypothetical protein
MRTSLALLAWLLAWPAVAGPQITVMTIAMTGTNSGYAGLNTRQVFATSRLTNTYVGPAQMIVKIDCSSSCSSCVLSDMWIGTQAPGDVAGTTAPQNQYFDGGQVPITWAGLTTKTMAASTVYTSDASTPFYYWGTARPLIVSMLFGGGTCSAASATTTDSTTNNYCNTGAVPCITTDQTMTNIPQGAQTQDAFGPAWISEIDLIEVPGAPVPKSIASNGLPRIK